MNRIAEAASGHDFLKLASWREHKETKKTGVAKNGQQVCWYIHCVRMSKL